MSKRKRQPKVRSKRTCLPPIAQMEAERGAMKKAKKKYPDDPQKARVEAQLILLGMMGERGNTIGR